MPVAARFRRHYGAHPLHGLVVLACFALTGYVAWQVAADPTLPRMLWWFAGAVVAHDLVLFPLYALADRAAARVLPAPTHRPNAVPALNYLRVPALASGLLLLLFFPGIIEQGSATYLAATGQDQQPFLARWLLLTAALFAASAAAYAGRLAIAARQRRTPPAAPARRRGTARPTP